MLVPIIDLFAGPGGLGEGFASFDEVSGIRFKLRLSVEKDQLAHRTLLLRAFLREFQVVPEAYYRRLKGEFGSDALFERFPAQFRAASQEARCLELGPRTHDEVDELIEAALPRSASSPWVLIGGPPCQAYSLVGRARMRSGRREDFEKDHRHFLYQEYLRIVRKHGPSVFVMENVKGMLSSSVEGNLIFERILEDFDRAGYNVYSLATAKAGTLAPADYVLRAECLDIPQTRHRVILLGIRKGASRGGAVVTASEHQPTVRDAIGDLPKLRSAPSEKHADFDDWMRALSSIDRRDLPGDIRREMRKALERIRDLPCGRDGLQASPYKPSRWLTRNSDRLLDPRLHGVINHSTRTHMAADLGRYFFSSLFASVRHTPPKLGDFPTSLLPAHRNVAAARKGKLFADRFRVQTWDSPGSTVVSHISKDGHYYIHPDPLQCRSFTVREAARIQTFPDNYFFEGRRTAQYHQVGNAVPPLLANRIAGVVARVLKGAA